MNNYKIRVNNEAESREAQELFFELGYKHKWDGAVVKESWNKARFVYAEDKILWSGNCSDDFAECNFQELTLPKLRDLVAQGKSKEQGLISGEEAYKRIGERIEVEAYVYQADGSYKWEDAKHLPACDILNDGFDFRLKPRTVKLEIEVPAPFEPKVGDMVWFISSDNTCGYSHDVLGHGLEEKCIQYGAWRTKAEIIIVVEQVRKLKGHSK